MTEVTSELRCFLRDVRAAGLCHRGSREWCVAHDVDWSDFITNGIPAQVLLDTNDPIVARVVAARRATLAQPP
jgi:hypothetical protein